MIYLPNWSDMIQFKKNNNDNKWFVAAFVNNFSVNSCETISIVISRERSQVFIYFCQKHGYTVDLRRLCWQNFRHNRYAKASSIMLA